MSKADWSQGRSAISLYLSEIHGLPRLTREQEISLGERAAAGDRESLDELVLSNLRFVVQIATEYINRGLPLDDMINEGNIGLVRAAARYDHRKGVKFITYATWWIRKTILKALEDHESTVRVPAYQRAKGFHPRIISLDDHRPGWDEVRLSDDLADEHRLSPEQEILVAEEVACVRARYSFLTEKERVVIMGRSGLPDGAVQTLDEIGERLGLSRERVRQIEMAARRKLRPKSRPQTASRAS